MIERTIYLFSGHVKPMQWTCLCNPWNKGKENSMIERTVYLFPGHGKSMRRTWLCNARASLVTWKSLGYSVLAIFSLFGAPSLCAERDKNWTILPQQHKKLFPIGGVAIAFPLLRKRNKWCCWIPAAHKHFLKPSFWALFLCHGPGWFVLWPESLTQLGLHLNPGLDSLRRLSLSLSFFNVGIAPSIIFVYWGIFYSFG